MEIPQRRVQVAPKRVPAVTESVAKNITLVLELPPQGFGQPFYIVTGYPNDVRGRNQVNPSTANVKVWIKTQHGVSA
jgi:hypothetical protein